MIVRPVPVAFRTDGTYSPRDVNAAFGHLARTTDDVQSKRYVHFALRLPFHRSASVGYTHADLANIRSYSFQFPWRLSIERAYLRFYGSSASSAPVTVAIEDGAGDPVAGASDPWLQVTPASTDAASADFAGQRLVLDANETYTFRLDGADFSSRNTWLEIHFRADRFNLTGTELAVPFEPQKLTSTTARNADNVNANLTALASAISSMANNAKHPRAELYVAHGVALGTLARWRLPQVDSGMTSRTLVGAWSVAETETAPSGSSRTAAWSLSSAGVLTSPSIASGQLTGVDSVSGSWPLAGTGYSPSDPADDASLDGYLDSGSGTVDKTYTLLWFE